LGVLTIDPLTRIEGHLKVELQVDDSKEPFPTVSQARCSGTLFRGIEIILKGRDPRDAFYITQRICGVCPTAHANASIMALDEAFGVRPPDNAILIRNIIQGANSLMSHILHFYILQGPEWGVLANLPEMLPPVKASLGKHYVKAIEMRRKAHELLSIFGGKMPHHASYVPGGVTVLLTPSKVASAQTRMVELKNFLQDVMVHDSERIVRNLKNLGLYDLVKTMGKGTGNFLSYGGFPKPETYEDRTKWLLKPTPGFDEREIRENVKYSWYDEMWTNKHPSERETKGCPEKPDAYSWITAPRYRGEVYETGPLARMVNSGMYDLMEPKGSALERTLARAKETSIIAKAMIEWISDLKPGERVFKRWEKYPDVPDSAEGIGLWEAPRGALGHWLKVEAKKIQRYQVVTPTNWNASPRDDQGRSGPMEKALKETPVPKVDTYGFLAKLGHPLAEKAKSLGLSDLNYWDGYNATLPLMIIRSFDPCLACSVHLLTIGKGRPVRKLGRTFHPVGLHGSFEN